MFWYWSSYDSLISHSGWGLSRMMVWRGFVVTLGWNTFFLMLATVILKLRMWEALPRKGASDWVKWCSARPKDDWHMDLPIWDSLSFNMPFTQNWPPKDHQCETQGIPQPAMRPVQEHFTDFYVTHNTHHEFHMGFNYLKDPSKKKKASIEANCWNFPYPLSPRGLCNASWIQIHWLGFLVHVPYALSVSVNLRLCTTRHLNCFRETYNVAHPCTPSSWTERALLSKDSSLGTIHPCIWEFCFPNCCLFFFYDKCF